MAKAQRVYWVGWRYETKGFRWRGVDVWPFRFGVTIYDSGIRDYTLMVKDFKPNAYGYYRRVADLRWPKKPKPAE